MHFGYSGTGPAKLPYLGIEAYAGFTGIIGGSRFDPPSRGTKFSAHSAVNLVLLLAEFSMLNQLPEYTLL